MYPAFNINHFPVILQFFMNMFNACIINRLLAPGVMPTTFEWSWPFWVLASSRVTNLNSTQLQSIRSQASVVRLPGK